MPRVAVITKQTAPAKVKELYAVLEKKIGRIPNIFQNMGNSPALLKAYLSLNEAANETTLPPRLRELIALVVAERNQCNYCLSAHTAMAEGIGAKEREIIMARRGLSEDPKTEAILQLAQSLVDNRGNVTDVQINALKAKGITDTEIVEVVLIVIINMFTNYFNLVTDPEIDFPKVATLN